jgi:RNA-directed DNA polymerase
MRGERPNQALHQLAVVVQRRHPNKPSRWIVRRYWRLPQWDFGTKEGTLAQHARTRIVRHVKIPGGKSPFDGDWLYWASRWGHYPEVSPAVAWLLQAQRVRCAYCKRRFVPGEDLLERHHKDGDRSNHRRSNFALLHRHCHDAVHRQASKAASP